MSEAKTVILLVGGVRGTSTAPAKSQLNFGPLAPVTLEKKNEVQPGVAWQAVAQSSFELELEAVCWD